MPGAGIVVRSRRVYIRVDPKADRSRAPQPLRYRSKTIEFTYTLDMEGADPGPERISHLVGRLPDSCEDDLLRRDPGADCTLEFPGRHDVGTGAQSADPVQESEGPICLHRVGKKEGDSLEGVLEATHPLFNGRHVIDIQWGTVVRCHSVEGDPTAVQHSIDA
jgi:hypothetical protein